MDLVLDSTLENPINLASKNDICRQMDYYHAWLEH